MFNIIKIIRKADIILAVLLVVLGLLISYFFSFGNEAGKELVVTVNGHEYGIYSLKEDQEITVNVNGNENVFVIQDSSVKMKFSNCTGQDCVYQHAISKSGETIVCLPNRVVLEVTGGKDGYDSVSH